MGVVGIEPTTPTVSILRGAIWWRMALYLKTLTLRGFQGVGHVAWHLVFHRFSVLVGVKSGVSRGAVDARVDRGGTNMFPMSLLYLRNESFESTEPGSLVALGEIVDLFSKKQVQNKSTKRKTSP